MLKCMLYKGVMTNLLTKIRLSVGDVMNLAVLFKFQSSIF